LPKSKTVNTKIIKRSGGNDTSESEKDTAELMPMRQGMRTSSMQFTFADPDAVLDMILTEVQLKKISVKFEYAVWEVEFPEENPVVHIKMMRVSEEQICVDFCRVG